MVFFRFTIISTPVLGPTPMGTGDLSGGGVRLITHLHLVPKPKNGCWYTSITQYAFMA